MPDWAPSGELQGCPSYARVDAAEGEGRTTSGNPCRYGQKRLRKPLKLCELCYLRGRRCGRTYGATLNTTHSRMSW